MCPFNGETVFSTQKASEIRLLYIGSKQEVSKEKRKDSARKTEKKEFSRLFLVQQFLIFIYEFFC
jgi:hypothetical protein